MDFPIIKIPQILLNIKNEYIETPYVMERPIRPNREEKRYSSWILIGVSFLLMMLGGGTNIDTLGKIGFFSLVIGLIWRWIESENNKKKEKDYFEESKKYSSEMSTYRDQESEANRIRKIVNDPVLKKEYLLNLRVEFFDNVECPNYIIDSKKGPTENYFLTYLDKYFPREIHRGQGVSINNSFERIYLPDFYYSHATQNYYVDIEIDEPYSFETGEPIHYYMTNDQTSDYKRDSFFLSCHWVVLRFSEEQVVKFPDECCKYIAQVISYCFGEKKYLRLFQNIPDIPYMPVWDYGQAEAKINNCYREKLLETIGIRIKNVEKNKSAKRKLDINELPF